MKMLKLLLILTFLCGIVYPLSITLISSVFFEDKAQGSIVYRNGQAAGSRLLAQKFETPAFFHSRPSASDYATLSSGASQSSPTQKVGMEKIRRRKAAHPESGVDAWTESGSGLDPHISPQNAFSQAKRVAAARGLNIDQVKNIIIQKTEGATFGIWGQARVNVLELNLSLLDSKGLDGFTR